MTQFLHSFFDNYGIKTVTATDKVKRAYVLSDEQCVAIHAAGLRPATVRPTPVIQLTVLFDKNRNSVSRGYYRSDEADRTPEPRMGKELITNWLSEGDELLVGNVGAELFVLKMTDIPADAGAVALELTKHA